MKRGTLQTKKEADQVIKWLGKGKEWRFCPWGQTYHCERNSHKCKRLFPKLSLHRPFKRCPCDEFDPKYVARKAKEFIKEWRVSDVGI